MTTDRAREALFRLLAQAHAGGQARVDALVALSQRTVHVALWGPGQDSFRTLLNSHGQTALPVFTEVAHLEEAATRFAWRQPDGSVARREVGAREAIRHVIAHHVDFLVVDICAPHAFEAGRAELEPLLEAGARRPATGPNAAVGRISTSMLAAQRPTPSSGSLFASARPTPPPGSVSAPGSAIHHSGTPTAASTTAPGDRSMPRPDDARSPLAESAPAATPTMGSTSTDGSPRAQARFGSGSTVRLARLASPPSDELLDALGGVLRGFPEVEWAVLCSAARGPAAAVPTVCVRVDASFRQRLSEIVSSLRRAGESKGAALDVLLLDDPLLAESARAEGVAFYPWKKR
ncbi:MAG: hypothetical protein NZ898_07435 [Myxococcota bacterium]|nr:hypothetical protein [Myxococcota bacterium]MDW8361423.1 hypothetical protein [Myxococcales bacterium]